MYCQNEFSFQHQGITCVLFQALIVQNVYYFIFLFNTYKMLAMKLALVR